MHRINKILLFSVDISWQKYFQALDEGKKPGDAYQPYSVIQQSTNNNIGSGTSDSANLYKLIEAYQSIGHTAAHLDPLGLNNRDNVEELDYHNYGFTDADLDKPVTVNSRTNTQQTLREVINELKRCYTSTVGVEFLHIRRKNEVDWIREKIEAPKVTISKEETISHLSRISNAVKFEQFCQDHFRTHKRFGLEGVETLIPGMQQMIDVLTEKGCEAVVIGMPHRGRLNVLANIIHKPLEHIFAEFLDQNMWNKTACVTDPISAEYYSSGDVKYHLGTTYNTVLKNGKKLNLSLLANPSHLEAADSVVLGRARAKQYFMNDTKREKVVSILMHGDGAFCGQGIVYESMQLAQVPNYTVGGTIHVIVNNQVAFTTDPVDGRSTLYCSDLGRGFDCPIFHVNSEDIDSVCHIFSIAAEYRQTFKRDVIIELVFFKLYFRLVIVNMVIMKLIHHILLNQHYIKLLIKKIIFLKYMKINYLKKKY